jgi:chorismate mutase/prephenate dehydratase
MSLKKLRSEIDKIDSQVLSLLNERTKKALALGKIKGSKAMAYYAPARESEIYRRLFKKNKGPLPNRSLKTIYREIISSARTIEAPLHIAYLGPEATFTHLASIQRFGSACQFVPVRSISDVFVEVEKGRANYGVVPIENSTEGVITHTLDMFIDSELKICSEIMLEVSHHLLSRSPLRKIKKVYSHSQAFAQCRAWIENNLEGRGLIEVSSTAEAARIASKEKDSGAIAGQLAAQLYNLKILSRKIEDEANNFTRFLVIGENIAEKSGKDKTSILFSIKDRVGALYDMLEPFAKNRISLTKIESRPSRRKAWEYVFFVDFEGHLKEARVKKSLEGLEKRCAFLKVLGSYPAGG